MELTHIYKRKATANSLHTSFRQFLSRFINRHAELFNALTRHATPSGGNWLPVSHQAAGAAPTNAIREQITRVQQQVDELTQTVGQLSDRVNSIQSSSQITPNQAGATDRPVSVTDEIGINRFRALRARP